MSTLSNVVLATGTSMRVDGEPMLFPTAPTDIEPGFQLRLRGSDLPPGGTRAAVEGVLTGRSLQVTSWHESREVSAWEAPEALGADAETVHSVIDLIPDRWPIISVGMSLTTRGEHVAMLEVDQATPEIHDWMREQPAGSVHLITFIRPT